MSQFSADRRGGEGGGEIFNRGGGFGNCYGYALGGGRAELIAAEKVRIQYRNMPTAYIGSAVICSLMGFALAKGAGLEKVLCWMAVVYAWVVARAIQWRTFNRINPPPADMRRWRLLGIG